MRYHAQGAANGELHESVGVGVTHTHSAGSRISVGPAFWNRMICASGSRVAR
jgi:hypothetical protein